MNDCYIETCIFKKVATKEDFEEILNDDRVEELTLGYHDIYNNIRIGFIQRKATEIYAEKGISEAFEQFHREYVRSFNYDAYLEAFNHWNGVSRTGIYYVYIPTPEQPECNN
jgi:hypothetical protein